MEWETEEHPFFEKSNDWYAIVIVLAGAAVAIEFFFHNYLLIALTVIAVVTFILLAAKRPSVIRIQLKRDGVRAGNMMFPYEHIDGFAIYEGAHETKILLESDRHMTPLVAVPIAPDIDPEEVRDFLSERIPEKPLRESLPVLLLERIGF